MNLFTQHRTAIAGVVAVFLGACGSDEGNVSVNAPATPAAPVSPPKANVAPPPWAAQSSGSEMRLLAVDFLNANYGWAVGSMATALHTSDGGATWHAAEVPQEDPSSLKRCTLSM